MTVLHFMMSQMGNENEPKEPVIGMRSGVFVRNVKMCVKKKKNKVIKHFLHSIYFFKKSNMDNQL